MTLSDLARARRVLVCLRWGIGDVVMGLPSLRALRRAVPHARLTALAARPATDLLAAGGEVDEVVAVQSLGISHLGDVAPEAVAGVDRWLGERERWDVVVDTLHAADVVRDSLWAADYGTLEGDQGVQDEATREGQGLTRGASLAAAAGWGVEVDPDEPPFLNTRPEDEAWADEVARGEPLAAIVPVASLSLKRWPIRRFAAVADKLVEAHGRVVALCGDDARVAEALPRAMRRADRLELVGATHLLRQAALLRRCEVVAGNDTGLLHMAAAVGTPVVGVFGPSSGRVVLPRHVPSAAVGGAQDCPHRRDDVLHMPGCWLEGRCLHTERRSCVDRVTVAQVTASLCDLAEARREAMAGG